MKKRIIALVMTAAIAASVSACSDAPAAPETTAAPVETTTEASVSETETETATTAEVSESESESESEPESESTAAETPVTEPSEASETSKETTAKKKKKTESKETKATEKKTEKTEKTEKTTESQSDYDKAKTYVGKSLNDLVKAVGKYKKKTTGGACDVPGEINGIFEYDGFKVSAQTKKGQKEWIVRAVFRK